MAETKLTPDRRLVLAKTPDGDAWWTSDITWGLAPVIRTTEKVRRILQWLAKRGLVEVVVPGGQGHPTSWRRTPAGTDALLALSTPPTAA